VNARELKPFVVFLALGASACAGAGSGSGSGSGSAHVVAADAETQREVARVLDDFHDAAAHADEARYFGHFAPGGVFLGTDATERWDVAAFRAYAHPHFAKGKGWTYRAVARHVVATSSGSVAWFDELLESRLGPCRGTGVLLRAGATFLIAQYNLTLTIPNERVDDLKRMLAPPAPPGDPATP
jgi:SnoaL-like domain